MTMIHNSNGYAYEILRKYEDMTTGRNVLLLASYSGKDKTEIQAGAAPTEYIVANDWNINWRSWSRGKYFTVWNGNTVAALESAIKAFSTQIEDIIF